MEIPLMIALKIQLIVNMFSILVLLSLAIPFLKLIVGVKKGNIQEEEKKKRIKKLAILSLIFVTLFVLVNIFFQLDPFNIIEDLIEIPFHSSM
jgi:amino acid transporter